MARARSSAPAASPREAPADAGGRLEARLVNRVAALEGLGPRVATFLDGIGASARERYAVELVLEEAFMNIVRHAFDDGAEHHVDLSLRAEPGRLVLELVDDGTPFDPAGHAATPRPTSIETARPGGLGLPLMWRYVDSLQYRREAGRNRLTLVLARR